MDAGSACGSRSCKCNHFQRHADFPLPCGALKWAFRRKASLERLACCVDCTGKISNFWEDLEKLDRFAESVEGELLKLIHGVGGELRDWETSRKTLQSEAFFRSMTEIAILLTLRHLRFYENAV